MKINAHIPLLFLLLLVCSCTTDRILKQTNKNLEQLNASIDEKFSKMSQPMNDISRNFAEMSKTINSFSKATEDGGIIDQLNQAFSEISAQDIKNSMEKTQESMEAFLELSKGIDQIGGVEGVMVQLTLGYTLGVQILETFKPMGQIETKGDIEQYLIAIQNILNVTKDNVDPTVQSIRKSIQTLIDLKAKEYDLDLNAQIDEAKSLENELLKAESALTEGLAFVEYYQNYGLTDITDLDEDEFEAFQKKAQNLAESYNQHAKEIVSMQGVWQDWSNNNQIASVE